MESKERNKQHRVCGTKRGIREGKRNNTERKESVATRGSILWNDQFNQAMYRMGMGLSTKVKEELYCERE